MLQNIARKIEIFVIVAIIAIIGIIYAFSQKPVLAPTTTNDQPVQQVPTATIKYQGVEGKTALELLKNSHTVTTKQFSFGEMVVAIDGVEPAPNEAYWAFYVNGSLAAVGAGSYVTKNGDQIEWRLEEIK